MTPRQKPSLVLALFFLLVFFVPAQTNAGFFDWFKNVFSAVDQETQTTQVIKTTRNRPVGMDGEARGKGRKFKVKDSHYADVVLESSTTITAEIKSIQNLIVIRTETGEGKVVLSLSNLPPTTTYFKYIDSLRTAEEVKTDSSGFLSFGLDMSVSRIVFLQTKKSTRFLNDDATGGNCTAIGAWTASTKTCKLNQDLNETIQIESDGIILDGNGHTLTGSSTGNGIYVNGRTSVVIKNISIEQFSNGIYVTGGSGMKVQNVNSTNNVDALELESHTNGLIENGTFSGSQGTLLAGGRGIELDGAINTIVTKNTLDGNEVGLRLNITAGSTVTQNTIKNNTEAGLRLVASNGETIYQNNFLSNTNQVTTALSPGNTSFDQPWPKGGNFWNDNPTCIPKTDNPNLCQEKYTVQSGLFLTTLEDNQPWIAQDKWVSPDLLPPPPPPPDEEETWAEISSTTGTATLYESASATSTQLKILPNAWALKVLDDDTSPTFWKVEDVTDNTIGWVESSKLNDDSAKQTEFEERAVVTYDTISGRKQVIATAVGDYFSGSSDISLFGPRGGLDGLNNFQSFISDSNFPKELVLAIAVKEAGGHSYDNTICNTKSDGTHDGGIGILQLTPYRKNGVILDEPRGLGGGMRNIAKSNDCYSASGWTDLESYYYGNSTQGIYANIKDGFRIIQNKYKIYKNHVNNYTPAKSSWFTKDSVSIDNTDLKILLAVRGYNGFGLQDCYRFNSATYLDPVGKNLRNIHTQFTGYSYSESRDLPTKMELVEANKTSISICSPGLLQIIDNSNRVTGYTVSEIKNEIPNIVFDDESNKNAEVLLPQENYKVRVIGDQFGPYDFYQVRSINDVDVEFKAIDIPISVGEIHEYLVEWDVDHKSIIKVVVSVDKNGDGVFESIFNSDSELTAEEFGDAISRPVLNFKLTPRTFNLDSNGVLTAHVELISGDKNRIDQSSWKLNGVSPGKINISDTGWELKFNRNKFSTISVSDNSNFELNVKIKNTIVNPLIKLTDSIKTIQNQNSNVNNSGNKNKKKI